MLHRALATWWWMSLSCGRSEASRDPDRPCARAGLFRNAFGVCAFAWALGCATSDGPPLAAVTGRLLVDGRPVPNVSVTFIPDNDTGTTGPASVGVTTTDGTFTLTAPGNRAGAVLGFHKVTAMCPFNPAGGSSPTGEAPAAGAACSIPASYADPSTTPLSVEVVADPQRMAGIELKVVTRPEKVTAR
jgi:hypothetical protein